MDLTPGRCADRVAAVQRKVAAEDRSGPGWNAVLEWNPDALADAEALDRMTDRGESRGPLHGLPILLKDNIDTADATHTSAGSLFLAERFAPEDSEVARRLRAAGAVLCGKTNMTELANFLTEGMPNGYSSRGGQVRSWPDGTRDPSGSSTGSAVAVAAGYVDVAIGTETCGSIVSPASLAGIVGLRPTVGRIGGRGILPIAPSRDTAGPLTRTVAQAALVFSVLADGWDFPGSEALAAPVPGWRVGVVPPADGGGAASARFGEALGALVSTGVHPVPFGSVDADGDALATLLVHEFRPAWDQAVSRDRGPVRTLEALATYNRLHPETCLRHGQTWVDRALALVDPLGSSEYRTARDSLDATAQAVYRQMDDLGVRAVLSPEMVDSFSFIGAPALVLPGPVFLYARPWDEIALFRLGGFLDSRSWGTLVSGGAT